MPGRGGKITETSRLVRHASDAEHEHQDDDGFGEESEGRRDGVFVNQPPAGLPDLRPRRRVRVARPIDDFWLG